MCLRAGDNLEIRETFHKLKGTGATYGVPEISQLGQVVESLCVKYPADSELYVPTALLLLRLIQTTRTLGTACPLEKQNSEYQKLANRLAP